MNRRRFLSLAGTGIAGVALVGCGSQEANPQVVVTKIPNVAGAPPTLAPMATPPNTSGAPSGGAAQQPAGAAPTSPPAGQAGAAGGSANITMEMGDIFFKPKAFQIPPNAETTVTLKNTGALPHDFNIDQLNVHSPVVQPGTSGTVTIKAGAGTYQYYCNEPGHKAAGMVGELTVSGAAAAASPVSTSPSASPIPISSPTGQGGGQTAAAVGSTNITMEMGDIFFKPKTFQIPANTEVTVTLKNTGALPHDFNIDQLNLHSPVVQPSATGTVKLKGPAGTYQYYCNEPGHKAAGMVGTLTIV